MVTADRSGLSGIRSDTLETARDLPSIERAIDALEGQRHVLGDDVVDTALRPLLEQRAALESALTGEQRKLVTVLFADLVDFTALSRTLDPEDTRAVVNAYFAQWRQTIESAGGVVEKFIGDAVMAVFGLRRAREDDPQAAVRAALAMKAALPELNERVAAAYGISLAMRVGIDTGDVVVSTLDERPGHEFVVVGDTVNRASRLQSAAPPDGILISAETHRHVRGNFGLQPMPGLRLKGIATPVDGYLVLSERPKAFRLDGTRGVEGIETTTVGRDVELRLLEDRLWDVVEERRWHVVTVIGDAGVGKTRLLLDFDSWLAESPQRVWWFRGRASPPAQNVPGALLRDVLAARFGINESDPPDTVRRKCEQGFALALGSAASSATAARLVATWLGFELGDDHVTDLPRDPQSLREQGATRLAEYFARLSAQAPVVVLLEDLHWADDGSIAWLDAADEVLSAARVLVVATARPALLERRPLWGEGLPYHVRMELRPLSRRESRALLGQLLSRAGQVPDELTDLVVTTAEGNPFYIEELVKWLLESGVIRRDGETWHVVSERVTSTAVPSTLRGVLQARLDALSPPERVVVQRASVIGRVFWDEAVDHLRADAAAASVTASDALDRLRAREVVYERELSAFESTREFLFKHALLRDVAYDGVLRTRRQQYHRLAAAWLEGVSERSRRGDEYAAVIADHYDRAGDPAAARSYLRAGRQATSVHALAEATRLIDRGLATVADTDPTLRLDLLLAREEVLDRGGDRPSQAEALAEADTIEPLVADAHRTISLLLAHARLAFETSAYADATAYATRAADAARAAGLLDRAAEAHLWRGKTLTWQGDGAGARAALTEALGEAWDGGSVAVTGETLRYLSMVANNEGDFRTALELIEQARQVLAADGDVDGEAMALSQFATIYFNLGQYDQARPYLERTVPVFRASGHRYRLAVAVGNLASIAMEQGRFDEARQWGVEALDLMVRIDDREGTATMRNVLGQIALALGSVDEAEQHLRRALSVAEDTDAKPIAVDSLHRLASVALARGHANEAAELTARALDTSAETGSAMERAPSQLAAGWAMLATGALDDADTHLAAAVADFEILGHAALLRESIAARALVAARRGDASTALALVTDVLPYLDVAGLEGTARPAYVLTACYEVLSSLDDPRAADVVVAADSYVADRAARIADAETRAAFTSAPANVALRRLATARMTER
jgi:class 3 adenylate cyclase/tetratricopeptide (TPR) repeat protein